MKLKIQLVSRKENEILTFVRQVAARQRTAAARAGGGFNAIGWAGRIQEGTGDNTRLSAVPGAARAAKWRRITRTFFSRTRRSGRTAAW